jgi:ATP-dependent RNA helicase RhlE
MNFNTLGLSDSLLKAIEATGYTQPTPIQAQAIPAILTGRDVMAAAQTGTGKTAGFTLPLLQRLNAGTPAGANQVRALVLTPTRELAAQVQESITTYGSHDKLRSAVVFGGVKINPQMMALRKGVDILVATPGRLLDLHQQNAVRFDALEILVLDEADRMLDMGFIHDIRRVIRLLPTQRQNLMFSATFSSEIRALAKTFCKNPVEIDVAPRNSTVEAITQQVYLVDKEQKANLLSHLLRLNSEQTLVFSRTKHGANKLVKRLAQDNISAAAIHGNKSQNQRTKALDDFKQNRIQVLVATDIAARGIDIEQLAQVINFDLPNVSEDYVHRIGRTGRAGATGLAISLVAEDETRLLRDIERLINKKVPRMDAASLPPPMQLAPLTETVAAVPANTATQTKAAVNGKRSENINGQQRPGRQRSSRAQGQTRRGESQGETRSGSGAVAVGEVRRESRREPGRDSVGRPQPATRSGAGSREQQRDGTQARGRNKPHNRGRSDGEGQRQTGQTGSNSKRPDQQQPSAGGFWQNLRAGLGLG